MEQWLEMMPTLAKIVYYIGAITFAGAISGAVMWFVHKVSPMPEDWWDEDGD